VRSDAGAAARRKDEDDLPNGVTARPAESGHTVHQLSTHGSCGHPSFEVKCSDRSVEYLVTTRSNKIYQVVPPNAGYFLALATACDLECTWSFS
jgi:hypothetical protein